MSISETPIAEGVDRVFALLQQAEKPQSFNQLKKGAHLDEGALTSALEAGIEQRTVFKWPDFRRSQYFWSRPAEQAAREAVLAVAAEEALSKSRLMEQACKRVRGFQTKAMAPIVAELVASKDLREVSAFTSGKLLVRSDVAAAAYSAAARKFIEQKFRKAGLELPTFAAAVTPDGPVQARDAGTEILEAMQSLEPVPGVPVSTQRLRARLPQLSKRQFDAAALELRNSEQVFLSLHHDPHNLPQEERDLLIDGGDGTFYVAIAVRR
jgi:hypothetical protein